MSDNDIPASIEIDEEIATEFLIESSEQLAESDENLLSLEADPGNEEARAAVFRCFHTIKGLAGFLGFHPVEHLAHGAEDLLDQAQHVPLDGEAIDAVFSSVDLLRRQITEIKQSMPTGIWTPSSGAETEVLLGEIRRIHDRRRASAASAEELIPLLDDDPDPSSEVDDGSPADDSEAFRSPGADVPDGWQVVDEPHEQARPPVPTPGAPAPDTPLPPPGPGSPAPPSKPDPASGNSSAGAGVKESIRVDAGRLDNLVDLVGEIVITESMVQRSADEVMLSGEGMREWERHNARLGKLIRELQELAGTLRMVPVRPTFNKMARLARDVSHKAQKDVVFVTNGENTELDKSLVDRIGDPLVHIIRNAIDHGIEESPDVRLTAGKVASGTVELSAYQQGGSINIEVSDDGRGLDRDIILAKAISRGVIREGDTLLDHEVFNLICESGFSTAAEVTEISGRGVGMDVVRKAVEGMGGKLKITSRLGHGTTFTMILPLTLAVIDGMVVQISGERFILPKLSVVRLVTPEAGDLSTIMHKGEMLRLQGDLIPVLRLTDIFGLESGVGPIDLVLVAEGEGQRVALVIDEIIDQQQLVVKSLGVTNTEGLSGCAILPDGRVGLVLDVVGLLHLASTRADQPMVHRRGPAQVGGSQRPISEGEVYAAG